MSETPDSLGFGSWSSAFSINIVAQGAEPADLRGFVGFAHASVWSGNTNAGLGFYCPGTWSITMPGAVGWGMGVSPRDWSLAMFFGVMIGSKP